MPVVETIKDKCKRCYSCIRNCPAKAIRVVEGQAEVISDRCIGCGTCVRVCAQHAKRIESGIEHTWELIDSKWATYAIVAPSFPAAFPIKKPKRLVGALRELGFDKVMEVALGADLTSRKYRQLSESNIMSMVVTSPCPALVEYIQKLHPSLLLFLAPIVSPMIAAARVIKETMDPNAKVVFIGPCIAKKKEKVDPAVTGVVDEVLTYQELKQMFMEKNISVERANYFEFDGPRANIGRIFPISGGLLRSAALKGDILENDIIVTEGADRVKEIIDKVEEGKVEARFLDLLFCEGCINGPVMDNDMSVFIRKDIVANYVRNQIEHDLLSPKYSEELTELDLSRKFRRENITLPKPSEAQIKSVLAQVNKIKPEDELDCGVCGYNTCREKAIAVFQGFAEVEMCLPYLIERMEKVNRELLDAQERLIRSARLASMGEVAAGVAHEINNPLAGVLTYTKLIQKKLQSDQLPSRDLFNLRRYLTTMESETIRVSDIVKNLLEFARPTEPQIASVSVPEVVKKALFLVRHQIELQNVRVNEHYEPNLPLIMADFKQIQQVMLNLFINAAQAMDGGGELTVTAQQVNGNEFVAIQVSDTGCGIPAEHLRKIFDPFFSTKTDRKGTGLGLSMVYQIIGKHGGHIEVESKVGTGTQFTVKLPIDSESNATEMAGS